MTPLCTMHIYINTPRCPYLFYLPNEASRWNILWTACLRIWLSTINRKRNVSVTSTTFGNAVEVIWTFSRVLQSPYYTSQQVARDTYFSCSRTAPRACVRARLCERARGLTVNYLWTDSLQIWWGHKTDPHRLHALFNLCANACPNSAHLLTYTNVPSPWRAMTSRVNPKNMSTSIKRI
jgi:hypothetical protein